MASDVKTASGSITANGQSVAALGYANGALSLFVGGTFTGTVQLWALPNMVLGDTVAVPVIPFGATVAGLTAPGLYLFPYIAGDYRYQVVAVAAMTGTAQVVLSAGPRN